MEATTSELFTEHEFFMKEALAEAKKAYRKGEVPIGAVIVSDGNIIARAHNLRETKKDPTAHAELLAIKKASKILDGWRLTGCSIYVTIEPCPMCAGAILQARIKTLVFGAFDPKAGVCGTLMNLVQDDRFNHQVEVVFGVLEQECSDIIKRFFRDLRNAT